MIFLGLNSKGGGEVFQRQVDPEVTPSSRRLKTMDPIMKQKRLAERSTIRSLEFTQNEPMTASKCEKGDDYFGSLENSASPATK